MKQNEIGPSKLFVILYNANLIVVGIILIYAILAGIFNQVDGTRDILLGLVLAYGFFITPILIPFLVLNIWRVAKYRHNRLRYIVISVILVPLILWGIDKIINMPFP